MIDLTDIIQLTERDALAVSCLKLIYPKPKHQITYITVSDRLRDYEIYVRRAYDMADIILKVRDYTPEQRTSLSRK